jgi:UDP-glucose:(glucosyl)LPS alpha-1,3-glucosyltransferase
MRIAIVTAADEKYLPAACCTLVSCVHAGRVSVPLFLIADNISRGEIAAARSFLSDHQVSVSIIERDAQLTSYRVDKWLSAATYSKIHLDQYFDKTWDRIFYLDADTRVMSPLTTLLSIDLRGQVLGAVDNISNHDHVSRLQMASAYYFNAGVLLFDWPKTLASGLLPEARAFATENGALCEFHDQDALNKVAEGAWMALDVRWNFGWAASYRMPSCRPYIKHYTWRPKPWSPRTWPFWISDALWYKRTLLNSPWPKFASPPKLNDVLRAAYWYYKIKVRDNLGYRLTNDGTRVAANVSAKEEEVGLETRWRWITKHLKEW